MSEAEDEFATFVAAVEPRLRQALLALRGPEEVRDAVQEALVYGWQHWERVRRMDNPAGYLYRVARSRLRWRRPVKLSYPPVSDWRLPEVEPGLPRALSRLTERQRLAVFLVAGCEWTYEEVGELMGVSVSTVRNHLARGLERLRVQLGVSADV